MAYSMLDENGDCQKIRFIVWRGEGENCKPTLLDWLPYGTEWVCDPCNPPSKRYEVTFPNARTPQYYRWWEVVHHDDDEKEVKLKMDYAVKVRNARLAMEAAEKEWKRLNG
jgi:hypothetical protein